MHSITVTKYVQGCHNSQLTTQPTQIAAMGKKGGGRVRVKQVGGKGMKGAAEALGNPLADLANAIPPEDQINFSPRSDKNVTQVWPLSMSFTLDHKGYSTLWPTYLDSTRTARQGRRIAAKDAVEVPSVQDLSEALAGAGIPHAVQPYRGYPPDVRSRWSNLGRVLVDLDLAVERMAASPAGGGGEEVGSEGFDVDDLPDIGGGEEDGEGGQALLEGNMKKALCREMARRIPNLPGRAARVQQRRREQEEEAAKEKERAEKKEKKQLVASPRGAGGASGGKNNKKKGKKRR